MVAGLAASSVPARLGREDGVGETESSGGVLLSRPSDDVT